MNETTISQDTLSEHLEQLKALVEQHYRGLGKTLEAALAVVAAMVFKRRTKPLCLVLETASGWGKSTVIQMLFPLAEHGLEQYFYRSDKFTPKAFVTHVANVPKKDLAALDMLPQLKDKVLLTKELAPIFRGKREELEDNFSTLITVLDGKGFTSNSGTRGKRGYEDDIVFNWIGATTPISHDTYRLMSQLGTRLLFFHLAAPNPTEAELMAYAEQDDPGRAETECQQAANLFVLHLFTQHPVSTVEAQSIAIPKGLLRQVVRWAGLLAKCRAGVKYEKLSGDWEPVAPNKAEGPHKILNAFKTLARARALIHGRSQVDESDLELVAHIALSSLPDHLRPLVHQLRVGDSVDAPLCKQLCAVSAPTAGKYLIEVSFLGVTDYTPWNPEAKTPARITLRQEYHWLRLLELEPDPIPEQGPGSEPDWDPEAEEEPGPSGDLTLDDPDPLADSLEAVSRPTSPPKAKRG